MNQYRDWRQIMALAPSPAPLGARPYNLGEAAAICREGRMKLRIAIAEGRLKAVKVRGSFQIEPDDLAEFVRTDVNKIVELP
jgi:hypothetical protein